MSMFGRPNPYDEIVANATSENLTSEKWDLILNVCDKVVKGLPDSARDVVQAVQKRIVSRNANVQLYSLTLTESLVKNCDKPVHREISSRAFTGTLSKLVTDRITHESVRKRILELMQQWAFEFRPDPTLGIMEEACNSLREQGIQFPSPQKPKKEAPQSELEKQKEEEELQLALALSLSETESRSQYKAPTSSSAAKATTAAASAAPKISRVRALYDFTPTESGELGFQKGDIIRVLENVYRDWWKGELRGKTGIFPVNYVEKIVDATPAELQKEAQMEAEVMAEARNVEQLLQSLASVDARKDAVSDNEQLQALYNQTLAIRPKLVRLIEKYSQKKDELIALNEKFLRARTSYDKLMESSIAKYSNTSYNYQPQQATYGTPAPAAATVAETYATYAPTNPYAQPVGQPQVQQAQGYSTYPPSDPASAQIYQDPNYAAAAAAALQQPPSSYLTTSYSTPTVAQQQYSPVNHPTPPPSQTQASYAPYSVSMTPQHTNTYDQTSSAYAASAIDQQPQQGYQYGYQPQLQDQAAHPAGAAPVSVQPYAYPPMGQPGYGAPVAQGGQQPQQQQQQPQQQGY
ncbi:SH3 domain protein [Endogone sp. FLAS-F59071]|nr:SH3 domain protein [Endogone sp. FLAS-F59071]|eukprot:RUS18990.1 SH3 domain protein [Endogone sp. FLAS-F59071]